MSTLYLVILINSLDMVLIKCLWIFSEYSHFISKYNFTFLFPFFVQFHLPPGHHILLIRGDHSSFSSLHLCLSLQTVGSSLDLTCLSHLVPTMIVSGAKYYNSKFQKEECNWSSLHQKWSNQPWPRSHVLQAWPSQEAPRQEWEVGGLTREKRCGRIDFKH